MSPYEIVNLIQAVDRYDPDWLPFTVEVDRSSFSLTCLRAKDRARKHFHTGRSWAEDITDRGIKLPTYAFDLLIGVTDVAERQKALRS